MKYCITWLEGDHWGKGFYSFYSEECEDGVVTAKPARDGDGKLLKPYVGSKYDCMRVLRTIEGNAYMNITPFWIVKWMSRYNAVFNALLNRKLGF